jgi:hypothetical protein
MGGAALLGRWILYQKGGWGHSGMTALSQSKGHHHK